MIVQLAALGALLYLLWEIFKQKKMNFGDDIPISIGIPLINDPRIDQVHIFHKKLLEKARKGPKVWRSVLPWKNLSQVTVGHPAVLREIYLGDNWEAFDRPIKTQDPSQVYHAGGFIILPNGANWRAARDLHKLTLVPATLRTYMPIFQEKLDVFMAQLAKQNPAGFDIQPFFSRYLFDNITRLTFGEELGVQLDYDSPYMKAWDDILALSNLWSMISRMSGEWAVPESIVTKHQKAYKIMVDLILTNLNRARTPEKGKICILDNILQAGLPEFMAKDQNETIKQLMTLLFGGHDTTTSTLTFGCHHLKTSPIWQKLIRDEVKEAFPNKEPMNLDKLESLKHLNAVIKETLRMYPAAPVGSGREMARDLNVSFVDVDGKTKLISFKKGEVILPSMYLTQNCQEFWNRPVEDWDPSRWVDDPTGGAKMTYAFSPFGNGQRKCLGERMAYSLARLTLAEILRNYEMHPAEDPTGKWAFEHNFTGTIAAKNGVGVRLVKI